jgi:hypothetical protein
VAVMLRLAELGWGSKRIAFELGCKRGFDPTLQAVTACG